MRFDPDEIEAAARLVAANGDTVRRIARESRSYYTGLISPETVARWLLQFRSVFGVHVALKLLTATHFVDEAKLQHLLHSSFLQVPEELRKIARITFTGGLADSGTLISYGFAKAEGWDDSLVKKKCSAFGPDMFKDADHRGTPIILMDDALASGIQLDRYFRELFPTFPTKREVFSTPLRPDEVLELKTVSLYLIVGYELGPGRARLEATARELGLTLTIIAGQQERTDWLEYGSPLWIDAEESNRARDLLKTVARQLYKDKSWPPTKLDERLLGYGNLQKLSVFAHNVPKSLLPVFWKYGEVDGSSWMPLFPERDEWRKYAGQISAASPEVRFVARQVISNALRKDAPALDVALEAHGHTARAGRVLRPSGDAIQRQAEAYEKLIPLPPPLEIPASNATGYSAIIRPSVKDVESYNKALLVYKEKTIPKHVLAFKKVLASYSSILDLPVRIKNTGSTKATGVTLVLELPDGLEYLLERVRLPELPAPPTQPNALFSYPDNSGPLAVLRKKIAGQTNGADHSSPAALALEQGKEWLVIGAGTILPGLFSDVFIQNIRIEREGIHLIPFRVLAEDAQQHEGVLTIDVTGSCDSTWSSIVLSE